MDRHRFDELLDDYLDGQLEGEAREAFERAVAEDAGLRTELEAQREIVAMLRRTTTPPAPSGLRGAVIARLREEAAGQERTALGAGSRKGWLAWLGDAISPRPARVALVACAFVAVVVAVTVLPPFSLRPGEPRTKGITEASTPTRSALPAASPELGIQVVEGISQPAVEKAEGDKALATAKVAASPRVAKASPPAKSPIPSLEESVSPSDIKVVSAGSASLRVAATPQAEPAPPVELVASVAEQESLRLSSVVSGRAEAPPAADESLSFGAPQVDRVEEKAKAEAALSSRPSGQGQMGSYDLAQSETRSRSRGSAAVDTRAPRAAPPLAVLERESAAQQVAIKPRIEDGGVLRVPAPSSQPSPSWGRVESLDRVVESGERRRQVLADGDVVLVEPETAAGVKSRALVRTEAPKENSWRVSKGVAVSRPSANDAVDQLAVVPRAVKTRTTPAPAVAFEGERYVAVVTPKPQRPSKESREEARILTVDLYLQGERIVNVPSRPSPVERRQGNVPGLVTGMVPSGPSRRVTSAPLSPLHLQEQLRVAGFETRYDRYDEDTGVLVCSIVGRNAEWAIERLKEIGLTIRTSQVESSRNRVAASANPREEARRFFQKSPGEKGLAFVSNVPATKVDKRAASPLPADMVVLTVRISIHRL
jgi:hypothetical protein